MAATSSATFSNVRLGGKVVFPKPVLSKSLCERVNIDNGSRAAKNKRGLHFQLNATVHNVTLVTPSGEVTFKCADDTFIVDAAEEEGFEVPFSCRAGTCSTCAGKIIVDYFP